MTGAPAQPDRFLDAVGEASTAMSRHIVENTLAQYCSAMDAKNAPAAARLLANADLFFKDQPCHHGHNSILEFYAGVFAAGTDKTAHMISNLRVGSDETTIFYSCLYQRARLNGPDAPTLLGIGCYSGRFARLSTGAWWLEHHVTAL